MTGARTDSGSPTPAPSGSDAGLPGPVDEPADESAAGVALWQATLAAEHAVIWALGLVGATGDLAGPADVALTSHRQRRSVCLDVISDLGAEPVVSAAAYEVDKPKGTAAARTLAGQLEAGAAVAYLGLTSSPDRATRLLGARWLREAAVAQQRWTGAVPPLPGFDLA